ncbi:hypothetical protein ACHAXT_003534 [Thalassiosira profunda]
MAAVAPRPPSPPRASPSPPFDSAANFDLPAAELAEGGLAGALTLSGEGGASSAASATLDVRTNFDGPGPAGGLGADVGASPEASPEVTTDESRQTGADSPAFEADGDDDAFSHFGDVAQLAAKAMESVDMERLCADLFAQEALAGEALGAATAQAAAVTHAKEGAGVVSPITQGQADAAASAKGSSLAVPSTIAVPSQTTEALMSPAPRGENKVTPAPSAVPAVPTKPALLPKSQPFLSHQAGAQGLMQPNLHGVAPQAPINSRAQFSSQRNGFEVPEAKRQRFDHPAAAAPCGHGGQGYSLPAQVDAHIHQAARATQQFLQGQAPSPRCPSPSPQASPASMAVSKAQAAPNQDEVVCARCHFPGADVQIRCGRGCAYHARCLDLSALCRDVRNHNGLSPQGPHEAGREVCVRSCPHCAGPAGGMAILPLSFGDMDRAQAAAREAFLRSGLVDPAHLGSGSSQGKRPPSGEAVGSPEGSLNGPLDGSLGENLPPGLLGLPTAVPSHAGAQPPRRSVPCYDPARPRTGRWTDAELAFRDALIGHFLAGALPLGEGLKLNDFLPNMLKSKQSRLAKKMKHAKLSTRYFRPQAGCVGDVDAARELSKLEQEFVRGVPDPVERSEIAFHMAREWRDHLARRLSSLGIQFDGRRYLASAEEAERRLALATERHRLAKRRFLMGKAMATDADPAAREEGVFVSAEAKDGFELAVERSVANSAGTHAASAQAGATVVNAAGKDKEHARWSSGEPNFRHAAPFLAGIASYVERNGAPFEHIDVWVPSQGDDGRLRHGGSATMGVQVVPIEPPAGTSMTHGTASPTLASPSPSNALRREPLPQEDRRSLSLFGEHSSHFSFAPGAGLPGRTHASNRPEWARRLADAPAFGVRTAAAVPVDSPTVGRVVVGLYSRHDRPRDEGLLARLAADLRLLNPCPRWKLVVDVDGAGCGGDESQGASSLHAPPPDARGSPVLSSTTTQTATTRQTSLGSCQSAATASTCAHDPTVSPKDAQIRALVLLLGETLPSDPNSPLGQQLRGLLSLRLLLLRGHRRTPEEDRLVDTVLVLFESYAAAGRRRADIAVMVARDFDFHLRMEEKLAAAYGAPPAGPASSPAIPAPPRMYAAHPVMAYNAVQRQCAQSSAGSASPKSAGSR